MFLGVHVNFRLNRVMRATIEVLVAFCGHFFFWTTRLLNAILDLEEKIVRLVHGLFSSDCASSLLKIGFWVL